MNLSFPTETDSALVTSECSTRRDTRQRCRARVKNSVVTPNECKVIEEAAISIEVGFVVWSMIVCNSTGRHGGLRAHGALEFCRI